jgi:hypothetical protein
MLAPLHTACSSHFQSHPWHQDKIDPNLDQDDIHYHIRERLPKNFDPYDLKDFLNRAAKLWNITLPEPHSLL